MTTLNLVICSEISGLKPPLSSFFHHERIGRKASNGAGFKPSGIASELVPWTARSQLGAKRAVQLEQARQ